jgi:secretion/DNA translocation related TadE-like protein
VNGARLQRSRWGGMPISAVARLWASRGSADRGNGTALAILLIAIVALAAAVVGISAAAHTAGVRAQGAADVAALAAATEARDLRARGLEPVHRRDQVCALAEEVAVRNNARLVDCLVESSGTITVGVEVTQGTWTVTRAARAGTGDK